MARRAAGGGGAAGEYYDDARSTEGSEDGAADKVYVAVKTNFRESDRTLVWALKNVVERKVVLVHVRRSVQSVDSVGSQSEQRRTHRFLDEEMMHATLGKYAVICESAKVQAEKIIIEMDDVAKGLVEIIALYGITKFVMGAAADTCYSKSMKVPKSEIAKIVQKEALLSCNIWFVCGGNLIYTREANQSSNATTPSFMATPISTKIKNVHSPRSPFSPRPLSTPVRRFFKFLSSSTNSIRDMPGINQETTKTGSTSVVDGDEGKDGSVENHPLNSIEEDNKISFANCQQGVLEADDGVYDKLQEIITEAEKLKCENFEEFRKRQSAERESANAKRKIKLLEMKINAERKSREKADEALDLLHLDYEELRTVHGETSEEQRVTRNQNKILEAQLLASDSRLKDLEEKLQRTLNLLTSVNEQRDKLQQERAQLQKERDEAVTKLQETKKLESKHITQLAEMSEELKVTLVQKAELESQLAADKSTVADLGLKLKKTKEALSSLEGERDGMKQHLDVVCREIDYIKSVERSNACTNLNLAEFSYLEIEQATRNFEVYLKIGEGRSGSVYKGFLRNTTVAIKVRNPLALLGLSEFHHEVDVLSKMRHPNLVSLMGVCLDSQALVYEYLPNGSLGDRLMCKNGSPPLSWRVRTCISADICSALIFLHSNKPNSVVHGNLKPGNVLLDAKFTSKVSDFGITRLLAPSTSTSKGSSVYMDPEFLSSGLLTPQSDIYAFGIIILLLLTGKQSSGIVELVENALGEERLQKVLDPAAGEWPFIQAQQLAYLGLRCTARNRKERPDLLREVFSVIEPMTRALTGASSRSYGSRFSFGLAEEDNGHIPSYFLCPIFQEVMRDPQIAADGFTYEAEALKGWLEAGHNTSPMTNMKLPNKDLIPNHALRSAIQEWLQQRLHFRH